MEETIKYFQPDITDLRVGYECEVKWHTYGDGINWRSYIVKAGDSILTTDNVRVPYLTKEQIEAEGWKPLEDKSPFTGKPFKWRKVIGEKETGIFNQDHIYTLEYYGQGTNNLKIHLQWESSLNRFNGYIFCGTCKDINTFRYICKLLNIK